MAKSDKGESEDAQKPEIVDEITEEVNEETPVEETSESKDDETVSEVAGPEEVEENTSEEEAEGEEQPETSEDAAHEALPEVVKETVVERKGGFFPMLLGGVLAAGVGVVSAEYIFPNGLPFGAKATQAVDLQSEITLQAGRIDDLTAKLETAPVVDTAALEAAVSAVGDLQAQIGTLSENIGGLDDRLTALEARPAGDGGGGVSTEMEREIEDLRAALDVQKGELAQMLEAAKNKQASAEETARQTMARAAVTRILVALDSGAPFADALAEVEANTDVALPSALVQTADDGVPTLSALSESFPEAARNALSAARSEVSASGGVGGFLTRQLGVRSVAPREGDDPDAVLSRAEAAVNEGRIADALAEVDTLPDTAKAVLEGWSDQANLRLSAAQEAEALANSLNSQ